MTDREKNFVAKTISDFIEAVAAILGESAIVGFPHPTGLGTDGTCWTDEEHRAYALAVANHAGRLLKADEEAERLIQSSSAAG